MQLNFIDFVNSMGGGSVNMSGEFPTMIQNPSYLEFIIQEECHV